MPIRADLRKFYGREWRTITRPRILARAENMCEQCRVPNYSVVKRIDGAWLDIKASWTEGVLKLWHDGDGTPLSLKPEGRTRKVGIVLTVAHLNHVAGDDRDENLKALCQYHHLKYDAPHHAVTRSERKDAARPLLTALAPRTDEGAQKMEAN